MDRNDLHELTAKLERQRDELKVKIHLAKMEAAEEWNELERKWDSLAGKLKAAGEEAGDAAGDVKTAASLLVEELKTGYERIRKRL